jgi:Coenzyme PQQ synthesis protein D (PqqD)
MVAHPDHSTVRHRHGIVTMTLRLRADVSIADTDNGMVLLDERVGRYWQLNPTGALVLRLLLGGATPHQVAQTLADHYPVSTERAAADIAVLLARLRTAGLVTDDDPSPRRTGDLPAGQRHP